MKISYNKPPIYDAAHAVFNFDPLHPPCFTYGDTLYNPSRLTLDEFFMAHEEVHAKQQENITPNIWWNNYLLYPEYRKDQEVEAYRAQYRLYCTKNSDPSRQKNYLRQLSQDLSKRYKLVLSQNSAKHLIQ